MEKSDLLKKLIAHYTRGNKAEFARMLGMTPGGLGTWINRNTFNADLILETFKEVNPSWLMTGEGVMLIKDYQNANPQAMAVDMIATIKSLTQQLAEAQAIIRKNQEQIDRLLQILDRNQQDNYSIGMAADTIPVFNKSHK